MTTTDVADAQLSSRDRKVIATLLVATFVVILNETIMGVALPVLMVDLNLSAGTVQWLTTAFMLTMAVVIPTTGFLLQRFSTRTVYGAALGLFSAGTLLAGMAPGFWVLLIGRIVQASGTAIMLPLLMTTKVATSSVAMTLRSRLASRASATSVVVMSVLLYVGLVRPAGRHEVERARQL